jgi:hypothetical protein
MIQVMSQTWEIFTTVLVFPRTMIPELGSALCRGAVVVSRLTGNDKKEIDMCYASQNELRIRV